MFQFIQQLVDSQLDFAFDVKQLTIDRDVPIGDQVDHIYHLLQQIYESDEQVFCHITKAYNGCKYLLEVAPRYDFDQTLQANGLWTHAILLVKFSKIFQTSKDAIDREKIIHLLKIFNTGLDICQKIVKQEEMNSSSNSNREQLIQFNGTELFPENHLFSSNLDIVDLLQLMETLKPELITLYANFNFCWLGSISRTMQVMTSFMAVFSAQWRSFKLRNWFSRLSRAEMFAEMGQTIHLDCLLTMWSITELSAVKLLMTPWRNSHGVVSKDIFVPRQIRWIVSSREPRVYDTKNNDFIGTNMRRKTQIRCKVLHYQGSQLANNSLLFHVHGGGFISQSPESHEMYLKGWIRKMKNVTVVSVNYSLSPESVYPEALQEVLDCYLWLTSYNPMVEKLIGFHPTKIAICGDSAGGNMAMSLLLALNDIHRQRKQDATECQLYRFPDGIFCFYTPFMLMTIVSPSRLISSIDGLIPVGALLSCLSAYIPQDLLQTNAEKLALTQTGICNKLVRKLSGYIKPLFNVILSKRSKPWYRRTEDIKQSLSNMNTFLSNPFISSLLVKHIDFNHIPLYLYPLTYDAFLDDSIEMAKKWQKDKVHIEVIDELPHGFLNLVNFNARAKEESFRCIPHMKKVLE